jgi:hypothetical protein
MRSEQAYTALGDEGVLSHDLEPKQAIPVTGAILLDGHDTDFTGYGIGGSNYFKLRDIMAAADVGVSWSEETRTINLDTAQSYTAPTIQPSCGTALLDTETIARKAASVVTLYMYDQDGQEVAQGSGFFIRENGWILTCYHVLAKDFSEAIVVTDGGDTFTVQRVLAYDTGKDLAIVKANGITSATPLALASSEGLRRGQPVMSISSPYAMKNTISSGLISGFRTDVDLRSKGLIDVQITAPVSSGSSGAPMFDMYGNVIGIIYAKHLLAENASFAIPINDFYPMLENLTPMTFEEMHELVLAAEVAKAQQKEQTEPSALTQSAAVSYAD